MGSMQTSIRREPIILKLPITIGSVPLRGRELMTTDPRLEMTPSAPPIAVSNSSMSLASILQTGPWTSRSKNPSAPTMPDDDSVTIRTYSSTPPPFPDDGKYLFSLDLLQFT